MESQDSEVTGLGLPLVQCEDPYLAPVHVSAGGTHYTTTLSTLTRCEESKLAKLFNGTLPIALDPVNHHYFMDINGSVFAHVLDYLRYGELILPLHFDQMPLLVKQAEQLEIWPLVDAVNMLLKDKPEEENPDLSDSDNNASSKKSKQGRHRKKSKKGCKMKEEADNLVTRLGEVVHGFMEEVEDRIEEKDHKQKRQEKDEIINKAMNLGDNIDTVIRANEDKKQKEDEFLDKLMKTLGDTSQTLAVDIVNRMDAMIKAIEDNRLKEDQLMDKLMTNVGDNFQRMLADSERQMERTFRMLEQRQVHQTVTRRAQKAEVIIVSVEYQHMKNEEGGPGYKIYFLGRAIEIPMLDPPDGVKASGENSYIWTYKDLKYCTSHIASITRQLLDHGYQLITACELNYHDPSRGCDYIFVRS